MDYFELAQTQCPVAVIERTDGADISGARPVTVFQKAAGIGASSECVAGLIGHYAPMVDAKTNGEFLRGMFFSAATHADGLPEDVRARLYAAAERTKVTPRLSEPFFEMLWANKFDLREKLEARGIVSWSASANVRSNTAFYQQIYLLRMNTPEAFEALQAGLVVIESDVSELFGHLRYLVQNVGHPRVRDLVWTYRDDPRQPAGVLKPNPPLGEWVRMQFPT